MFANAQYVDADQSAVSVEIDGTRAYVPASVDNRHFRELLEAGVEIAAYVAPAPAEIDYATAMKQHLDTVAQSRRYDNAISLALHTSSSIPAWAAEAAAFVSWRDAVWSYAYEQLAAVQSGQAPAPTVSGFIASLPAIQWPG
jgi:hypothetical protein